jgi:hypothetical protein
MNETNIEWHVQTTQHGEDCATRIKTTTAPYLNGDGVWEFAHGQNVVLLVPSQNVLYIKRIGA